MADVQYVNPGDTLVAGAVLYAGPCVVYFVHAVHDSGAASFIQVFDAVSAPADNTVPHITHSVKANDDAKIETITPTVFRNGLYICESSTAPKKTIVAGTHCFFVAGIEPRPNY